MPVLRSIRSKILQYRQNLAIRWATCFVLENLRFSRFSLALFAGPNFWSAKASVLLRWEFGFQLRHFRSSNDILSDHQLKRLCRVCWISSDFWAKTEFWSLSIVTAVVPSLNWRAKIWSIDRRKSCSELPIPTSLLAMILIPLRNYRKQRFGAFSETFDFWFCKKTEMWLSGRKRLIAN